MAYALPGMAAAFMFAGSPADAGVLCEQASRLAPEFACAEAPNGIVLAQNEEDARALSGFAEDGERRFEARFGTRVGQYAVIDPQASPETRSRLRSGGFTVQLPWQRGRLNRRSEDRVRRQAAAQGAAENIPEPQVEAFAEEAVRRFRQSAGYEDSDLSIVPHELGHRWYVHLFWPGFEDDTAGEYGGPGPDWLDEVSAVLMEPQESAQRRGEQFREAYAGEQRGAVDSLSEFLHRTHPMTASMQRLERAATATRQRAGTITIDWNQVGGLPDPRAVLMFYSFSRVFADFLLETSQDRQIFRRIGVAFSAGKSIEEWLASDGTVLGLPRTVADLDTRWQEWLGANYNRAGSTAP